MSEELEIGAVSAASPDMSDAEMEALKESIAKLGQLEPIWVQKGVVIDGRKRLAACRALGLEPNVVTIPDAASPAEQAIALNLLRTHYTLSQRSIYAAEVANLERGRPEINKQIGVFTEPSTDKGLSAEKPVTKLVTQAQAAKLFGVSQRQVNRAKGVRQNSIVEVTEAVKRGRLSLYAATQIAKLPKEQQAAKLAAVLAVPVGKDGRRPTGTIKKTEFRKLPKKDPIVVVSRVVDGIESYCEVLEEFHDAVMHEKNRPAGWTEKLRKARGVISRFERDLQKEK